jgi:AcrR family transcriptional regulator
MATTDTPAKGTRPRNRREITLQVATDLFARRGYAQVGMVDIARAMNVGASALYRHFPGKADLLVACIETGIEHYARALAVTPDDADDPARTLTLAIQRLADCSLEYRQLGVLWQREARNLPRETQRELREILSSATGVLATLVLAARPELDAAGADELAWFAMGALVSISFHTIELPRTRFAALLVELVETVVALPGHPDRAPAIATPPAPPAIESRRDNLVAEATELFAERGFAATGIDEIGVAAGIAGPSVYGHFASKQTILVAAIERASSFLRSDLVSVLESDDDAPRKLSRLVDSYVGLAVRERFVLRTLLSEMAQLPDADREASRLEQRRYIDSWVGLLAEFSDEDATSARIRVQAVLLVVNDAVQTPHLRSRAGFEQTLGRLSRALLGIGGSALDSPVVTG